MVGFKSTERCLGACWSIQIRLLIIWNVLNEEVVVSRRNWQNYNYQERGMLTELASSHNKKTIFWCYFVYCFLRFINFFYFDFCWRHWIRSNSKFIPTKSWSGERQKERSEEEKKQISTTFVHVRTGLTKIVFSSCMIVEKTLESFFFCFALQNWIKNDVWHLISYYIIIGMQTHDLINAHWSCFRTTSPTYRHSTTCIWTSVVFSILERVQMS